MAMVTAKIVLAAGATVIWIQTNRPKVCYKKYLGPDWKPRYDNFSSRVSNHSAWADILAHMYHQTPSFVSKSAVLKIPFIGKIAELCGSLFLERASNDSR